MSEGWKLDVDSILFYYPCEVNTHLFLNIRSISNFKLFIIGDSLIKNLKSNYIMYHNCSLKSYGKFIKSKKLHVKLPSMQYVLIKEEIYEATIKLKRRVNFSSIGIVVNGLWRINNGVQLIHYGKIYNKDSSWETVCACHHCMEEFSSSSSSSPSDWEDELEESDRKIVFICQECRREFSF